MPRHSPTGAILMLISNFIGFNDRQAVVAGQAAPRDDLPSNIDEVSKSLVSTKNNGRVTGVAIPLSGDFMRLSGIIFLRA